LAKTFLIGVADIPAVFFDAVLEGVAFFLPGGHLKRVRNHEKKKMG